MTASGDVAVGGSEMRLSPSAPDLAARPPTVCRSHDVFPIAIRDDLVVRVGNLPVDLTRAEADRIGRLVRAHVLHDDARSDAGVTDGPNRDERA